MSYSATSQTQQLTKGPCRYRNLAGANFAGVDIRGIDFEGADLTGANFEGAIAGVSKTYTSIFLVICSGSIFLLNLTVSAIGGYPVCFPILWGLAPTAPFLSNFFSPEFSHFITELILFSPVNAYIPALAFVGLSIGLVLALWRRGLVGVCLLLSVAVIATVAATVFICLIALFMTPIHFVGAQADPYSVSLVDRLFANLLTHIVAADVGAIPFVLGSVVITLCIYGIGVSAVLLEIVRCSSWRRRLLSCSKYLVVPGGLIGAAEVSAKASGAPREIAMVSIIFCLLFSALTVWLALYTTHQALKENPNFSWINERATQIAAKRGTRFRKSILTEAIFQRACISGTDLTDATLIRTDWTEACHLSQCLLNAEYLKMAEMRRLVVKKTAGDEAQKSQLKYRRLAGANLKGADLNGYCLESADLYGADLSKTNLQNAQLTRSQLDNANLTEANLTGAYIESWGITSNTCFDRIVCDYVYVQELQSETGSSWQRLPSGKDERFKVGQFERFLRSLSRAIVLDHETVGDLDTVISALKETSKKYKVVFDILAIEKSQDRLYIKVSPITAKTLLDIGESPSCNPIASLSILRDDYRACFNALLAHNGSTYLNKSEIQSLNYLKKKLHQCSIFFYNRGASIEGGRFIIDLDTLDVSPMSD